MMYKDVERLSNKGSKILSSLYCSLQPKFINTNMNLKMNK